MDTPAPRSPNRVTGLPPGVEVGPLGARLVAQVVDLVVPAVALALLIAVVPGLAGAGGVLLGLFASLLLIGWLLVTWRMFALQAAGPGMRLMRLQLVGFTDGRPIGWARFLARQAFLLALALSVVGLVIMVVMLVRHPRHQGWPDQAANSVVIAQRALAPAPPRSASAPGQRGEGERTEAPSPTAAPQVGAQFVAPQSPAAHAEAAQVDAPQSGGPRVETAQVEAVHQQPPEQAATGAPRAAWSAALDDGRVLAVEGLVLIGRNPQPQPGEEDALLVKIADETRTVSKSHLALGVDDAGLFVIDRGSTNGSVVTTLDGTSVRCAPGQVVSVEEGAIVSLGDHWLEIRRSLS